MDVTIANDDDSWKDALNTLKSIAGDKNVVENKGLGFYVTCSKACHKEVADFIDSSNHSNTQQVLFRVLEITVATTSVGQSGVDWNLVYKNLGEGRKYNFTFGTRPTLCSLAPASSV
ncbi:hypothetical protein ACHMW6_00340 (plasmid) [Pseudoduganella sp. UC29_106]|uniref:hypothetical protein n=1 Tax=Pseudoduganella sp. UC29_106 TaxID=3374553 RepID=UPI0037581D27